MTRLLGPRRSLPRLLLVPAAAAAAVVLLPATPASAHPLGNFSVNQYLGLTLRPDRVDATVAVDFAEIPTLQDRPSVDSDRDGTVSAAERSAHAGATCATFASTVDARVGGDRLRWTVTGSSFGYSPGAGGLEVSRLGCSLTAPAPLTAPAGGRTAGLLGGAASPAPNGTGSIGTGSDGTGSDGTGSDGTSSDGTGSIGTGEVTMSVTNGYLTDRVGWRELTATGDGIGLVDPPVPATSVSDELRRYPQDLLSSALDVRSATLRVTPGPGTGPADLGATLSSGGDPISRWMSTVDRRFQDLAGGQLTPLVGALAVLLAILLGAGHAALPGHGKTVLAAYLAGKRGRPRDALAVAGTVTLTHTGGVIILGLVLTAGTALAGEAILGWLGLLSGVVVLAVGVSMLRTTTLLRRHHPHPAPHPHPRPHVHPGPHIHPASHVDRGLLRANGDPLTSASPRSPRKADDHTPHDPHPHEHPRDHDHGHEGDHDHDHAHGHGHGHGHGKPREHGIVAWLLGRHGHSRPQGPHTHGGHSHGPHTHTHSHPHAFSSVDRGLVPANSDRLMSAGPRSTGEVTVDRAVAARAVAARTVAARGGTGEREGRGRLGMVGIGLAGGLVPSPSALVVLLAAIGLGRTAFGILLVVAYGAGMALTLTGAGLLLVVVQRRLARATRADGLARRFSGLAARLNAATPAATAALVLVVGAGLAARAAVAVL